MIDNIQDKLDVRGYVGHGSHPDTLDAAGAEQADMIIAVTLYDEVNMVAWLNRGLVDAIAFNITDWAADESLAANNDRVARRDEIIPELRTLFAGFTKDELMAKLETTGLPFAPIQRPEDLATDPHLVESGGLLDMTIPEGGEISLPAMPIAIDGARPGLSINPPEIGEHSAEVLRDLGLSEQDISRLIESGRVDAYMSPETTQAAE